MQLNGLDMAFLCMEEINRPMHMGALLVFDGPPGTDVGDLLVARAAKAPKLALAPRDTWWPPAGAAWSRHPGYRAEHHVRVHRLAAPATPQRLAHTVAELMTTPLRAGKPPWELHVLNGLPDGRFAVLAKLHHAMVDGAGMLSLAGGLLDDMSTDRRQPRQTRPPKPRPMSPFEQLLARPADILRHPGDAVGVLAGEISTRAQRIGQVAGIASATVSAVRPSAVTSPLTSMLDGSGRRKWTSVRLDSNDLNKVRKEAGGTFNDVLLSIVAGGLREWLGHYGTKHALDTSVRALIPVSVRGRATGSIGGNHLSGYLVDLPIGEPDPVARLHAMRDKMLDQKTRGPGHGAGAFGLLAQVVPSVAHRLATPTLARLAPLLFDTLVTTVPLPDVPLRLGGAGLQDITPIAPLAPGHGLSVAIAVYRGTAHIGLLSDPDVLPKTAHLPDAMHRAAEALRRAVLNGKADRAR